MARVLTGLLALAVVLGLITMAGCGTDAPEQTAAAPGADSVAQQAAPAVLDTPFTAEQIRDSWVVGLSLKMVNATQYGKQYQRWTVVSADEEGADIEYVEIDAEGTRIGPPQVRRSLWVELRDHARFPAEICTRSEESRDTPLGKLDGWVYTLTDKANDATTDFFFAHSMPGAPVHMLVKKGGVVIQEMTQEERSFAEGS